MKYCTKCGKELMDEAVICPGCGCAAEKNVDNKITYDDCIKCATTTNVIATVILALGVFCALFVNVWLGVVLCLATELIALIPNTKLQNALKSNNNGLQKNEFKSLAKQCQMDLKAKYSAFKFSFILAFVALACLIVFALLGNAMGF